VGEAEALVEGAGAGVLGADVEGDRVGAVLAGPLEHGLREATGNAGVARSRGDPHGLQLPLVGGGVFLVADGDDRDRLITFDREEPGGVRDALLPDGVLVGGLRLPALPEGARVRAERTESDLPHERPVLVVGADDFGHRCPPEPWWRGHGRDALAIMLSC